MSSELRERLPSTPNQRRALISWVFLAVLVTYASLSTYWTTRAPDWYDALDQPAFQPPDLAFSVVWSLNFLCLAVVGVAYCLTQPTEASKAFVALFTGSAAFALGWSYLFYVPHLLFAAALSLLLGTLLTWLLVFAAARADRWLGLGLVLYAAWLSFATALAFAYAL